MADIIGELGLDTSVFEKHLESAAAEVARLTPVVERADAAVKLFERAMRKTGDTSAESAEQLKSLRTIHSGLASDLKSATTEAKSFNKVTEESEVATSSLGRGIGQLTRGLLGFAAVNTMATFGKDILNAYEKMIDLNAEVEKLTVRNLAGKFVGEGDLKSQASQIEAAKAAVDATKSVFEHGIETWMPKVHKMFYTEAEAQRKAQKGELDKQLAAIDAALASKQNARNEAYKMETEGLTEAAKIEKVRLDYAERIGDAVSKRQFKYAEELKELQKLTEEEIKRESVRQSQKIVSATAEDQAKAAMDQMRNENALKAAEENKAYDKEVKNEKDILDAEAKQYQEHLNHQASEKIRVEREAAEQLKKDELADQKHLRDMEIQAAKEKAAEEDRLGKEQREKEKKEYAEWIETKKRMEEEAFDNAEENRKFKEGEREKKVQEKLKSPDQRRQELRDRLVRERAERAVDKDEKEAAKTAEKNRRQLKRDVGADVPARADEKKAAAGFTDKDSNYLKQIAAALSVKS